MIKFIATDLDGTFVDDNKTYDKERFLKIFEKLKKNNILFGLSSGNQYYYLYNVFQPISDDILYIAENGNYIAYGSKELKTFSLNEEYVHLVVDILKDYPEVCPILCGKSKAYIEKRNLKYEHVVKKHYSRYEFVDDFKKITDEQFMKFSIHTPTTKPESYTSKIAPRLPEELVFMTSGNVWMDIQKRDMHKGIGMQYLKEYLNLKPEECAVFGDQNNDLEVMKAVKYSYCMSNGSDDVKAISYKIIGSNNGMAVLDQLEEILKGNY